jgi:hypothetical protein
MAFTKRLLSGLADVLFGARPSPPPPASENPTFSPPRNSDDEFSLATLDEIARVQADVRAHFDAKRAKEEKELGLAEKQKRLEKAQTYLRKADVEAIFKTILNQTWYWPSWKDKGALDDLPRYGLNVTDVRQGRAESDQSQSHGFTIKMPNQTYDVDVTDIRRGYTPDGYGDRQGEVAISVSGEVLFACSIIEQGDRDYGEWRLSIWGLKVFKDVSWLPDFAEFSEILVQRSRASSRAMNDKRIIEQTENIIDPTKR